MKPKLINQHTCIDLFKFWKPKQRDPNTQFFLKNFLHFPTNQKQRKCSISQANPHNFQKENFARLRRLKYLMQRQLFDEKGAEIKWNSQKLKKNNTMEEVTGGRERKPADCSRSGDGKKCSESPNHLRIVIIIDSRGARKR